MRRWLGLQKQPDVKGAAFAFLLVTVMLPPCRSTIDLAMVKPKPEPPFCASGGIAAVKTVEDIGEMLVANAGAVILEGDSGIVVVAAQGDPDLAFFRVGKLNRIEIYLR